MTERSQVKMLPGERKAIFSLGSIFFLRMFGLFMILPVISIHASGLPEATPVLVGMALGAYGLTQALLQIPFGLLSDKFDRRLVIAAGLIIFAVGSVVAALSSTIEGLILGRGIQGAGAISAAILALTSDLTRSNQRTKAMALIGVSIGFSFMCALIIAPPLHGLTGISGMFWVVALLAVVAVFVLFLFVPQVDASKSGHNALPVVKNLGMALKDRELIQLYFGIFVSHMILTSLFLVLPQMFVEIGNVALSSHWKLYLPILAISAIGMLPLIKLASKPHSMVMAYRCATGVFLLAMICFAIGNKIGLVGILIITTLFFIGFNSLESILPSLVSQISRSGSRGTAMGVYNTFQFLGVFSGGLLAGLAFAAYEQAGVFVLCLAFSAIWFVITLLYSRFKLTISKIIEIGDLDDSQRDQLIVRIGRLKGVEEVKLADRESVAYLEIKEDVFDDAEIQQLLKT